jgi:hypothetical protein
MADNFFGEFKNGYRHGKGKLTDYFQKCTKRGVFKR